MILGFHLIITTYGFWLPNAESGSGSDFVRADHLTKFGPANPVSRRRSVAYNPFDVEIRKMARASLDYDPVEFTGRQALSVGTGFGNEIRAYGGTMYACSILPNHVHQVVGPHRYDVRRFAGRLKGAATKQLRADGLHPFEGLRDRAGEIPSPWSRLPWVVYLWTEEDMRRAIRYVEQNPVKKRLPKQKWSFVSRYLS